VAMKKIELTSRKLLRKIFGGISLTAMAFTFQACYGMPYDDYYDVKFTGTVKSKNTDLPIKGIKVLVDINVDDYGKKKKISNVGITDEAGEFDFKASVPTWRYYSGDGRNYPSDSVKVNFLDIDGIENGSFVDKTIFVDPARKDEVKINVALEEKQ
jgi:putative lipoprotein (rSAM/lipoprotein system)